MKNIQGSGHVYALNEDVYCRFLKNPKGDSYFGSLNGDVKLYFQSPLSAEFALKTFNGDIYSDFPSTHIPAQSVISTEHNSKNIYKCEHPSRIRIGKGGPLFEFDGFNGDLFILKNQQ